MSNMKINHQWNYKWYSLSVIYHTHRRYYRQNDVDNFFCLVHFFCLKSISDYIFHNLNFNPLFFLNIFKIQKKSKKKKFFTYLHHFQHFWCLSKELKIKISFQRV
jgi:hypothetical protein